MLPQSESELVVKKANEYGAVEVWMNERVRRACSSSCADFIHGFREVIQSDEHFSDAWRDQFSSFFSLERFNSCFPHHVSPHIHFHDRRQNFALHCNRTLVQTLNKGKGEEFWLVWRYEGDATLDDLMKDKNFPYNVRTPTDLCLNFLNSRLPRQVLFNLLLVVELYSPIEIRVTALCSQAHLLMPR